MQTEEPNRDASEVAEPAAPANPGPVTAAPLFRKFDWLALLITFVVLWGVYLFTLAPELTLANSGELCTAAFYAGVPHPPGYPFWVIYGWLWTVLVPFGSVAWRVEAGESFAAAMGCGLVALMVSRGSSLLMEGIEELNTVTQRWKKSIGLVAGCVAGLLVGLDACLWSESVVINRISLFGVPWLTVVLVLLMRWIYEPQKKSFLYWSAFVYGLCATIHPSLLLSTIGIEVAIAAADIRLGRDLFLANSLIYVVCPMLKDTVPILTSMSAQEDLIFQGVGISSILIGACLCLKTRGVATEWRTLILIAAVWVLGVSLYVYEPISGMTNPPMQWGYPRTVGVSSTRQAAVSMEAFTARISSTTRSHFSSALSASWATSPTAWPNLSVWSIFSSGCCRFCSFSRCKSGNAPGFWG
jgi:hypothetical protein